MIVVADTSPLCYLILIEEVNLLSSLFNSILIPQAVFHELKAEGAPKEVKEWMNHLPDWVKVTSVKQINDFGLDSLHSGEREAIMVAEEIKANLIILDEKAARKIAKARGLNVTGLLGILEIATSKKLIDLPTVIARLQKTNFRASPHLLNKLLAKYKNPS